MEMMNQMMGQMMPKMQSPPSTAQSGGLPTSDLPGFPGASHILHIGATGFFLDHAGMAKLTTAQLTSLNRLKEHAVLARATVDQKILRAEEAVWTLTASDQPDLKKIEAKIKESEALKAEKRVNFIRSVGTAAKILTPGQVSIFLGTKKPIDEANQKEKTSESDSTKSKGNM